jgi:hypothetical protein
MHAPYDRSRKSSHRSGSKGSYGFLLLMTIAAFAMIALVVLYPKSSVWISQAIEAEVGGGFAADPPVQTAQPGMVAPVRTVDAY